MRYPSSFVDGDLVPHIPSHFEHSVQFFIQLAVILVTCRLVGMVARRFGQPQVVGEMIAGVALGPSLFGLLAPSWQQALFPKIMMVGETAVPHPLMTVIYCTAQIGLAMYMFLVGLEFRTDLLVQRARSAASVSLAGILAPFVLGCLVAWGFHENPALFKAEVKLHEDMLFLGAAMSITAFPMLARIIYERGLTGTSLGTLALAAGSIDDALAWCVLAIVLASFGGSWAIAVVAIGGGTVYAIVTMTLGRRMLAPLGAWTERDNDLPPRRLAVVLVLLMLAAWYTDKIGIYAVFGAFILGLAMPRGLFADLLQRKMEPLVTNFLLPMFFVYSGLNTQVTLIDTPMLWAVAILILGAACAGKGVACYLAARLNGEPNQDALAVGALMNARGLMELIILNIGRERGIVTPTLFAIMVIMAIVTTLIATPLFEFVYGRHARRTGRVGSVATQ
ncbi:MAG: cation:proton antiporter [Phycisphaerae bacterium]|nr:cation:proton antiporter [Phycisphaerae bacterium]